MGRHSIRVRIGCALACGCLTAAPTAAQTTRADGPFAGLFGGVTGEHTQALNIRGSLFGAYDHDVLPDGDASTSVDQGLVQSGGVGGIDGTVSYERRGRRTRFNLNGGGSFQKYAPAPGSATYSAETQVSVDLTRKLVFDAQGHLLHVPFYQFAPSLTGQSGSPVPLPPGYHGSAAVPEPNTSLDGTLSLTSNYSKRSTLSANARWQQMRFRGGNWNADSSDSSNGDFREWGVDVYSQHKITRPLAFHVGYGRYQVREGFSRSSALFHLIDVGLDYNDDLSLARRTTMSFTTSTAVMRLGGETHYRLGGSAKLMRGIARTWSASLEYVRDIEFIPGFGPPLLYDAVNASLGGLITPRVQWYTAGGFSFGQIGFDRSQPFGAYTANSTVIFGITRLLGVFSDYSYYRYRVPIGSSDIPLLPMFSRHAVTVGLTAWIPIINPRSSRDSR